MSQAGVVSSIPANLRQGAVVTIAYFLVYYIFIGRQVVTKKKLRRLCNTKDKKVLISMEAFLHKPVAATGASHHPAVCGMQRSAPSLEILCLKVITPTSSRRVQRYLLSLKLRVCRIHLLLAVMYGGNSRPLLHSRGLAYCKRHQISWIIKIAPNFFCLSVNANIFSWPHTRLGGIGNPATYPFHY